MPEPIPQLTTADMERAMGIAMRGIDQIDTVPLHPTAYKWLSKARTACQMLDDKALMAAFFRGFKEGRKGPPLSKRSFQRRAAAAFHDYCEEVAFQEED